MKRRTFLKVLGGMSVVTATGLTIGCEEDVVEEGEESRAPDSFPEISTFPGQKPEARIDLKTGDVDVDDSLVMRNSACLGCYSSCGNRVKIEKETGKMLKVYGNPYSPNNAEPYLNFDAPLTDSYLAFSAYKNMGNTNRATLCARGNGTLESHYDPMRILTPLKRAGERGSGKWKPITWEQAVEETVEGGNIFSDLGEDINVEGFRQVRDIQTPLNPDAEEYGPKSNQLVFFGGRGDGRTAFASRFIGAFGTQNYYSHGYS